MQKAVLNSIRAPESLDPAFDSEALQEFREFLDSTSLTDDLKVSLVRAMETSPKLSQPLAALSSHDQIPEDVQDVLPFVEEETEAPIVEPVKKKRGGHAQIRTAELGTDPRAKRAQIRSSLRPGYYLCYSGKKNVKTLHKLGVLLRFAWNRLLAVRFSRQHLPISREL